MHFPPTNVATASNPPSSRVSAIAVATAIAATVAAVVAAYHLSTYIAYRMGTSVQSNGIGKKKANLLRKLLEARTWLP